jgi:hypothetical protein
MFKFLAAIFGGPGWHHRNRAQRRQALQVRLGLQELSHRIVPSGCASGAASAGQARAAQDDQSIAAVARSATADSADAAQTGHMCGAQAQATLAANLSNASGATGTATINADSGALTIDVQGAATDTALDVAIDGTNVGAVSTDASSNGSIELSNVSAQAGSTITVGDLSGTFAQSRLTAALSGTSDAWASASFDVLQNQLRMTVHGAAANTTFDVSIDGRVVGQLTTNDLGEGKLVVSPAVALQVGSTIAILDAATSLSVLDGVFA